MLQAVRPDPTTIAETISNLPANASLPCDVTGSGPRIVLLHGFTQTRASWSTVSSYLAAEFEVMTVDLPGHGQASELRADLTATARALVNTGGDAIYVGYSMGGRVALRAALDFPDVVHDIITIGATAGIEDPDQRAARLSSDETLAISILENGLLSFLDDWVRQPLFGPTPPSVEDLAARRLNTPEGLAASLRLAGTGRMDPPWWEELSVLRKSGTRLLAMAGEHDTAFVRRAHRLAVASGSNSSSHVLKNCWHACHLQAPKEVARLISCYAQEAQNG